MGTRNAQVKCFGLLRVGCAVVLAVAAAPAGADDSAARLRLAALVEEGDLLLEETAQLEPVRQRSLAEGEQLADSEKALSTEVANTEKDVSAYNAAVATLAADAATHAKLCPPTISATSAVQCNDNAARLAQRAADLEQQRVALAARQGAINARVEQHNAARETWMAARREQAPRIDANASDTQRWITSARGFMTSADFRGLQSRAGDPSACARLRLADATALFGHEGLKQLHTCLRAVARAI